MRHIARLLVLALLLGACGAPDVHPSTAGDSVPESSESMIVYKSPTCGCCQEWIAYIRRHGWTVAVQEMEDLSALKAKHGVPEHLQSCHLALIDGYVLEGHVPVPEITKLLRERPALLGLAVPGMPMGSPGMEMPNGAQDAFDVVSFDAQGATAVFAHYGR